ncbi:carbonic anhydrase/acetyltransferase-like protein (isoleucine patch superfamily) [Acinetobacter guillouiae]|nr:carbonic anhydrase/acetyltransferase-like protein (isoleucine patch superfamily) [Acinetobacter guillouiae]
MMYKFKGFVPKALHAPFDGWIADNATVIGQVELGQQVSVWFGAVIRADNAKFILGILVMFKKMPFYIQIQGLN